MLSLTSLVTAIFSRCDVVHSEIYSYVWFLWRSSMNYNILTSLTFSAVSTFFIQLKPEVNISRTRTMVSPRFSNWSSLLVKRYSTIQTWQCTDKLNSTTDHFRLPSVAWKRRVLKLPNSCGQPRGSNWSPLPRWFIILLSNIFGIDVAMLVCNFQSKNWLNCRIKGHLFRYHKLLGAFVVVCWILQFLQTRP